MRAFAYIVVAVGLFTLVAAALLFGGGCMTAPRWVSDPTEDDAPDARPVSDHLSTPGDQDSDSWTVRRVGGDMDARITGSNGDWRFADSRVDTPLPDGYPPPTPPGAIELKRYSSVRRAEYHGNMHPIIGMNFGFWPLFKHIEERGIAMTSPVEVDYYGWDERNSAPDSWTMSFLYRSAELGPTGNDGKITVSDNPSNTVLSIGINGAYTMSTVRMGMENLEQWLATQNEWKAAGEPRAFFYNDPGVPRARRWIEVQIPVARIEAGEH